MSDLVERLRERNATVWPDTLWLAAADEIEQQRATIDRMAATLNQNVKTIERLRAALLNERERCAQVAERYAQYIPHLRPELMADEIAAAIRTLKDEP